MVGETAREQGLTLTASVAPDVQTWVVGDALRLRQALLNLLSNAVKFTPAGSVELAVTAEGGLVRFTVTDTGIGIDPAAVPQLFRPFTQADAGTTRRYGGTGLGLAITREIALLHGGSVGAAPREGSAGSAFWFTAVLPPSTAPRDIAPVVHAPDGDLTGRVLVAEDNLVNQQVATLMLEAMGLTVDVVADGRAALDAAAGGRYDLVLMDCQMPEMDGLESARALRASGCLTPVLALTASASRQDELACREAGMNDYLTKPIDPAALEAALRRHLPRQVRSD